MPKKAESNLLNDYHLLSYDVLDSTNEEAKRLAGGGGAHGAVIWAKRQTNGRGRMGVSWFFSSRARAIPRNGLGKLLPPEAVHPTSQRSNEPTHFPRFTAHSPDDASLCVPGSCHPRRMATNRRQKQNTAPATANGMEGR
jgi:hypothetical protein